MDTTIVAAVGLGASSLGWTCRSVIKARYKRDVQMRALADARELSVLRGDTSTYDAATRFVQAAQAPFASSLRPETPLALEPPAYPPGLRSVPSGSGADPPPT